MRKEGDKSSVLPRSRSIAPAKTYTAEEVGELRVEWERDQRDQGFAEQLARLEGQYNALPNLIENGARRIFQEMWTAAQQQAALNHAADVKFNWRRADTLIAAGQFILAIAIIVVATRH